MEPIKHIIATLAFFLLLKFFFPIGWSVLLFALILNLAIDIFEHGFGFVFGDSPLIKRTRFLIKNRRYIEAYKNYLKNRYNSTDFAVLHNLLFFSIAAFLSVYLASFAILIGIVFHMACDMAVEFHHTKSFRFWLVGWINLLKAVWGRVAGR